MIGITVSALVAVILSKFLICLMTAILLLVGNILWIVKLFTDSPLILNTLFMVPLIYSILIFMILLIFLHNMRWSGKNQRKNKK